jgi:hypothetical protein
MSEDETKRFNKDLDNEQLLKQVLASLERLEVHVTTVEGKIDQASLNTKPIWERALSDIAEVNRNLAMLGRKIDVFNGDMLNLRAEQLENENRLSRLETENERGGMTTVN